MVGTQAPPDGDAVIRAEGLTKAYGNGRGIHDVTFSVQRGEVFGFLGPNGAGKTTTIRTLLDLLRPTGGSVRVFGLDPRVDGPAVRSRVGYLAGELGAAGRVTAGDELRYVANLRGGVPWARVEALAERLRLDLDLPVRQMSRGNKQKVGLVQAFMHEPELLILDEPTGGLDPLMQREFNRLVGEARARGATVFLSSHILPEVEHLCDRVGVIRDGRLVTVAPVDDVKARAVRRVHVRFTTPPPEAVLADVAGVETVHVDGHEATLQVRGALGPLVRALADLDVADLTSREPSLEEVFLGFYDREDAAGAEGVDARA